LNPFIGISSETKNHNNIDDQQLVSPVKLEKDEPEGCCKVEDVVEVVSNISSEDLKKPSPVKVVTLLSKEEASIVI
jgi:hypothetical protein